MEIFNNQTKVVRDDLKKTIQPHSRVAIAAACFSIYAYQELKKELEACDICHADVFKKAGFRRESGGSHSPAESAQAVFPFDL